MPPDPLPPVVPELLLTAPPLLLLPPPLLELVAGGAVASDEQARTKANGTISRARRMGALRRDQQASRVSPKGYPAPRLNATSHKQGQRAGVYTFPGTPK